MRNELITFRNSVLAGMLSLVAASCSDDAGTDNRLPEGKYPITFTAAVDGLAVSRATTDNDWTGGEGVAIQIGDETKKYQAAAGGNLSIAEGDAPFYWQSTDAITVNAWYPYNGGTKPADNALRVKVNQSRDTDYQASDYLEAVNASVVFNNPQLTFTHRTAKVSVTLEKSESVPDVSGATVGFINQAGVEGGGTEVISKKETADGNVTTYTALLVPQKMDGKPFIKVTIVEGDFARDYYYIPEEGDADLKAGYLYTYKITVKKTGLEVTEGTSVSWNETSVAVSPDDNFAYQITAPTTGVAIAAADPGASLSDGVNGSYILSGGNKITVTAESQSNKLLKYLPIKGFYDIISAGHTSDKYTYTYTLKGDISISAPEFVDKGTLSVGDYYYFDGTWSAELWDKPCVGIVFKVGAGKDDELSNYSGSGLTGQINGYAVALTATTTETNDEYGGDRREWGNISSVTLNTDNDKFYGYSNTKTIRETSGYNETNYWACYSAVNYAVVAPSCSSGWYLPSLGEYNALWQVYDTIKDKLPSAGGTVMERNWGFYWTSSKKNDSAACVDFGRWNSTDSFANAVGTENAYVRPVLTF